MFIGYTFVYIYAFALIFIIGNILIKRFEVEVSRKIIHILLSGIWIIIDFFMKNTIHQIIVPFSFIVINILSYHLKIFKTIERKENNHLGTIYFAIAIAIVFGVAYFHQAMYPCTGVAVVCLTFGDGFAGLLGYQYGVKKIWRNKSIVGSVSCFLFAFAGCLLYKAVFWSTIKWYDLLIISLVVAIAELADQGIDNFTVPLSAFFLSYGLIFHSSERMYMSLSLSIIVFVIVLVSKSIDYYGALASMIIVFCYSFFGLKEGIAFVLFCYGTICIISFYKKHYQNNSLLECQSDGKQGKNVLQILSNGGMGTFFIILYGIYQKQDFLFVSLICISGCFIDSISSDIGTFSKEKPYDFLKKKYVDKGISGGVSALGLFSAALFTLGISFLIIIISQMPMNYYCMTVIIIYTQTLLDSCFGSLIQVKLCCSKCGKITEKKVHCGQQTQYYSGIAFVDNNIVNVISSVLVGGIAWLTFVK